MTAGISADSLRFTAQLYEINRKGGKASLMLKLRDLNTPTWKTVVEMSREVKLPSASKPDSLPELLHTFTLQSPLPPGTYLFCFILKCETVDRRKKKPTRTIQTDRLLLCTAK